MKMTQEDFDELEAMLNTALCRMGQGARAFITSAVHTDGLKVWELFNRTEPVQRSTFVIRVYKYLPPKPKEEAASIASFLRVNLPADTLEALKDALFGGITM